MTEVKPTRDFINRFDETERSMVANIYMKRSRWVKGQWINARYGGYWSGQYVSINFYSEFLKYLEDEVRDLDESDYFDERKLERYKKVIQLSKEYPEESKSMYKFYKLSRDERNEILGKPEGTSHLPPTEKQLNFIKRKGYKGEISTRGVASKVISTIIKEGL